MDGSLSSESIACFGWWISVSEMRGKGARGIGVGKLRGGGGERGGDSFKVLGDGRPLSPKVLGDVGRDDDGCG